MALQIATGTRRWLTPSFAYLLLSAIGFAGAEMTVAPAAHGAVPITQMHMDVGPRKGRATDKPRKEADQTLVRGWPLYRTKRGQQAYNHTMATLAATDVRPPSANAFSGCRDQLCSLKLPKIDARGWIPAGRLWTSPNDYILFVHSPRKIRGRKIRRRSSRTMRFFVFHEFHNSTRNTDVFDTISAHKFSVFVPFYIGKQGKDARGRNYVTVIQVAPYDVKSRHASNMGHRGPGVEVAKNKWESLPPLQSKAGVLLAAIVKQAAPRLKVVHHRYKEGLPMLRAYQARVKVLRAASSSRERTIPFTPARSRTVALISKPLNTIIRRKGLKPARRLAALPGAKRPKTAARTRVSVAPRVAVPVPAQAVRPVIARVSQVPEPQIARRPFTAREEEAGSATGTPPQPAAAFGGEPDGPIPNGQIPEPAAPLTMNGLFQRLFGTAN
ncbi:MAG: hypothetical protein AAGJ70_10355 [Pseudomonadota bacterium]